MLINVIVLIFIEILKCLSDENNNKKLTWEDLNDEASFLVFIYLQHSNYSCQACEYYKNYLGRIKIPVKTINFQEDIELASRFRIFKLPGFVLRKNYRSYYIQPSSGDELIEIVNGENTNKLVPFKKYLEIDAWLTILQCKINSLIFMSLELYDYIQAMFGDFVLLLIVFSIITYLVYSIVSIFISEWYVSEEAINTKKFE